MQPEIAWIPVTWPPLVIAPRVPWVVSFETLIEWRWDAEPPAHPRVALHSGVARLRRLLGHDLVETVPRG